MKPSVHLYITHFFLEWERFQTFRENQNRHFVFNNFFSKIVPFMRYCGKILYSQTGHKWQYGTSALYAGYLRIHTLTICNTYCFPLQQWLHERALPVLFLHDHASHYTTCCFLFQ